MLIFRLIAVLLALCIPASAHFRLASHGAVSVVVSQTIASVPLSGATFLPGSPSGTVVGTIGTPVMSPSSPAFSGSCCTLSGTDAASFQIVGSNLETNGTPCPSGPCTFSINLVATQAGISNSPFSQPETIASSPETVQSLIMPSTTFPASTPNATINSPVVLLTSLNVPNAPLSIVSTGTDHVGTTCTSTNTANFQFINGTLAANSSGLAAGSYPGVCVKASQVGAATFTQAFTVTAVAATGNVGTISFVNAGSGTSPGPSSLTPVHFFKTFAPGDVPAGSIAVPKIGGTAIAYQADCAAEGCPTWPDGSLRGIGVSAFIPQLASGATETVTFTVQSGSYPTTSTIVPSGITAVSDFKIPLSQVNNSYATSTGSGIFAGPNYNVGCYISGSALSSCVIRYVAPSTAQGNTCATPSNCDLAILAGPKNSSVGTGTVVPATFTSNNLPATLTITSGGSGYSLIGSGNQTFDANYILGLYGSIDPPTCAAELGAGVFSANYSAGALTTTSVTSGHIATGQIVTDSLGATAVVTGTSSPWAVSAALTSGAMTAQTPVCSYASGPVMKGYRVFGPFLDGTTGTSGTADAQNQATVWIEMWSLSGTPYSVRAVAMVDKSALEDGTFVSPTLWQSYTYDADIMNGTAEIRGNASGGPNLYTRITDQPPGAWYTVDPALSGPVGASARPDWLGVTPNTFSETTSLGINSVITTMTTTDKLYFKASKAMMPMNDNNTPSQTIVPASTSGAAWDSANLWLGYYRPFGPSYIDNNDSNFGNAGNHFFLSPQGVHLPNWYMATDRASDKGASWLQQMRVAGLMLASVMNGAREPDTWHALNVDPTFSNAAYTDPVRLHGASVLAADATMTWGGQISFYGDQVGMDHWPSGTQLGPYLADGERYQLDEMTMMAMKSEMDQSDYLARTLSFNGNAYYGLLWDQGSCTRCAAWGLVAAQLPTIWGMPNEPDIEYWNHVIAVNYNSFALFYPYIGTFTEGIPTNLSGTKTHDITAAGNPVPMMPVVLGHGPPYNFYEAQFMDSYLAQTIEQDQMWGDHALTSVDSLSTWIVDNYVVQAAAINCSFNLVRYNFSAAAASDGTPISSQDATHIATPGQGNWYVSQNSPEIVTNLSDSGGTTVTVTIDPTLQTQNPPPPPSGSLFNPSLFDYQANIIYPVPSPLNDKTWYTWCSLTSTTGTINPQGTNCSSPAPISLTPGTKTFLTSTIAPNTTVAAISMTGSISGTDLNISSVSTGTLYPGTILTGPPGVAVGTQVISGPGSGGVGDYVVSISQTVGSGNVVGTYGILTRGAGSDFPIGNEDQLTGSGVAGGTTIWGQGAGATWIVSPSQTVSSTTITENVPRFTGSWILNKACPAGATGNWVFPAPGTTYEGMWEVTNYWRQAIVGPSTAAAQGIMNLYTVMPPSQFTAPVNMGMNASSSFH